MDKITNTKLNYFVENEKTFFVESITIKNPKVNSFKCIHKCIFKKVMD